MALAQLIAAGVNLFVARRITWGWTADVIVGALRREYPLESGATLRAAYARGTRAHAAGALFDRAPPGHRMLASEIPPPTAAGRPWRYSVIVQYQHIDSGEIIWRSIYPEFASSPTRQEVADRSQVLAEALAKRERTVGGSPPLGPGWAYTGHEIESVSRA